MSSRRTRTLALVLCLALAAAACGSGGDDTVAEESTTSTTAASTTTAEATTTTTEAPQGAAYRDVGPFGVGVITLTLSTGNDVEVYYPSDAVEPNGGLESYRVREFLPEALQPAIPETADDEFKVPAERAVEAAAGPFPLVVFSHGFAGFRLQSTHLMTHLASWGMVVASADHPSRDLESLLNGFTGTSPATEPKSAVDDVTAAIALVRAESASTTSAIAGRVDPVLLAVGGHSAGGGTALQVAQSDAGVAGYIGYASGTDDAAAMPDVPSLFLFGASDGVADPTFSAAAFEAAPGPSWSWQLADSGHLAFSDLCEIGDGQGGLIGMADAAGFAFPADLRSLAEDGCLDPAVSVRTAWPAIDHASVAFYRFVFGIDDEPVGLSPAAAGEFELTVTIEEKP